MSKHNQTPVSFSFRNGLFMPFIYKGQQIVVHNASWSFREKVWVNDELVVNQNGFSMASTHEVNVAGDTLSLTFGSRNKLKDVFLEARKGNELVYEVCEPLRNGIDGKKLVWLAIASTVAGLAVGYLAAASVGGA
tara:strand:+ start:87 stop:491 length:405 start_codon:yes stop_codon:yes gene_type:complete